MQVRSSLFYSLILIVADTLTLLAAFSLAYIARVQLDDRPLVNEVYAVDFLLTFLAIVPLWIIVLASLGLYSRTIRTRRAAEIGKLLLGSLIGILLVIGYAFVIDQPVFPARLVVVYVFIGSFVLLVVQRQLLHTLRSLAFRRGDGAGRVLVIGNSDTTRDIVAELGNTKLSGYKIAAVAGPKRMLPHGLHALHYATVEAALNNISEDAIDVIIQTDLYESAEKNKKVLSAAQTNHIEYKFIPGEAEFYSGKNTVDVFLGYPLISVSQTPLVGWGEVVKRIFDVVLTTIILIVLLPFLLIVVALQKALNPGPVLYKSKRLSKYSEAFTLYKFRSMRPEFGKHDAAQEFRAMGRDDLAREYETRRKVAKDPRITHFGSFLRKTSIDELPQLLNVLRGQLSLVGPRPILPQEMRFLTRGSSLLHSVKSGVTGLWQVSGRNDLSFENRIELELYYAQNWSFWLDVRILLKTIAVVLRGGGAK